MFPQLLSQQLGARSGERRCRAAMCSSVPWVQRMELAGQLTGHTGCINTVSFDTDGGDILISGSDDRQIVLWDWQQGRWMRGWVGAGWLEHPGQGARGPAGAGHALLSGGRVNEGMGGCLVSVPAGRSIIKRGLALHHLANPSSSNRQPQPSQPNVPSCVCVCVCHHGCVCALCWQQASGGCASTVATPPMSCRPACCLWWAAQKS